MEDYKQFNFRPILKNETFLLSSNVDDSNDELQDKLGELSSVSFSRARKRRESAAIFNRLNEDTSINLLNDPLELRTFEEEDVFEILPKEIATPEMKITIEKNMEINRDSTSQHDAVNTSQKYLSISSEKNACPYDKYQQNVQAMNNTSASTLQKRPNQDLVPTDNTNNKSLLIEQRARTTLNQFKEMMSKFKTMNVDTQPPSPVKSISKPELLANLSHIKCPDDVVCLVNHLLYSPIGIHRSYPAQEIKIREQPDIDVNDNNSPLREQHVIKELSQSKLFPGCVKRELSTQKNEITEISMDFQQPVLLRDTLRVTSIDKRKILRYENKFSLNSLTHSQRPGNKSNNKGATSQASYRPASIVDLSNNKKQRNAGPNNESSTENLDERNEFRKRKRTVAEKPLTPHLRCINDSNKIQAKSGISPAAKKVKTQPSNLRAPTSISRLKCNAERKVGSLDRSTMNDFKVSTNSQLQLPRRTSNTKQCPLTSYFFRNYK